MANLIIGLFMAASIGAAYLVNGWVFQVVWDWFIVPFGAPELSLPWAIGVSMVIGYLTNHNMPKKNQEDDAVKLWLLVFLRPLMVLGIGWILHRFM